jgi:hypothetical protein
VTREVEKECSSVRRTPGLTSSVCTLVAGGTSITLNTGTYVGGADSSKEGWDIGLDPLKVDVADVRGSRRSDAAVVVDENVGVEKHDDRIWTKDPLLDQKKYGLRNVDIFFIRCIFLPCQADFV